jgi:hypothetical protein
MSIILPRPTSLFFSLFVIVRPAGAADYPAPAERNLAGIADPYRTIGKMSKQKFGDKARFSA